MLTDTITRWLRLLVLTRSFSVLDTLSTTQVSNMLQISHTRFAITASVLADKEVFSRKGMTSGTVSFSCVPGRESISQKNVGPVRENSKMLRIYAFSVAANMIYCETLWNRTKKHLIRYSMSVFCSPGFRSSWNTHLSITRGLQGLFPVPTSGILVHNETFEKSFYPRNRRRHGFIL